MTWPADAYVGQKVVCVRKPDRIIFSWEMQPKLGEVYTIRDIILRNNGVGIRVVEIVNHPAMYLEGRHECMFWVKRFRPVQTFKNDISVFQRLADKANEKAMENA
jgi:hypothetical protein